MKKAGLILYNGEIHTLDAHNPIASAVFIKNGKFVAVYCVFANFAAPREINVH